jgi:hypothetical protein
MAKQIAKTPKKAASKPSAVVKKTGAKKEQEGPKIKYADKSGGQPLMQEIFEAIKQLMLPYAKKGTLKLYGGTDGKIVLTSEKPLLINGKKMDQVWFVSMLVQKGYVGFYYMPIYMNDPMKKHFSAEFLKCLKGKACFHIKKNDPAIMLEIKKALQIGYAEYEKRGWV